MRYFPLKKRELIRGVQAHLNAGLGAGADYRANQDVLHAPTDGEVTTFYDRGGGNWIRLFGEDGYVYEFAHLDRYEVKQGHVKAQDRIAVTGNTGRITTGPHLHVQIKLKSRYGRRLDPEVVFAGAKLPGEREDVTVDQYAKEYENILARVHKLLNGKDPNMDSIRSEAYDAAERRAGGEEYAVNSYLDKYFNEKGM